jgi:hypothetical protein
MVIKGGIKQNAKLPKFLKLPKLPFPFLPLRPLKNFSVFTF